MKGNVIIEVKKSKIAEQIDISYKISSKEILKILRESGEITSINLWRGRSPNDEAKGVSADKDIWEINIRKKIK